MSLAKQSLNTRSVPCLNCKGSTSTRRKEATPLKRDDVIHRSGKLAAASSPGNICCCPSPASILLSKNPLKITQALASALFDRMLVPFHLFHRQLRPSLCCSRISKISENSSDFKVKFTLRKSRGDPRVFDLRISSKSSIPSVRCQKRSGRREEQFFSIFAKWIFFFFYQDTCVE